MFDGGGVRDGFQAGDLGQLYMAVRYRREGWTQGLSVGSGVGVHLQQAACPPRPLAGRSSFRTRCVPAMQSVP